MKNNIITMFLSVAFATLFLFSCDDKTVFAKYEHTPLSGWEKTDTLVFTTPHIEQSGIYTLNLMLRTDNTFPFTGIEMVVGVSKTPFYTTEKFSIFCPITNSLGQQQGDGVNLYQHSFHINTLSISEGDSLRITVNHNMMRDIMPGISDVGVSLVMEE